MVKILYWSAAVSIGGFLFGFDTAVISGADQPLQQLWKSSDIFHGALIMSSALWGTVVGALSGNIPTEQLGRKKTLIIVGTLYFVSAIGSALSINPYFFFIMRFIGGIGVGISSIVVPAYIAEISPAKYRGRLVALYQFQIVFGILVAFLSNFLLSEFVGLGWRWMLGIEVIPALIFLLLVTNVPESPRWLLLRKNEVERCRNILSISHPNNVDRILDEIQQSREEYTQESLFSRPYFFPILLAFLLALFNQMSGINFVIYFAPRVFSIAGLDSSAALLSSAGIGLVNLISTLLGILLIDRVGRKKLMLIGSIGYIISLFAVSWAFFSNADGMIVVFFIFLFIVSHAIGQGAVIWVYIAEIFPNNVRTKGQSMGCGTHWVAAAVITLLMPYFLSRFETYSIFGFFGIIMILQLLFVIFVMPETKGKSLESISQELYKRG
jgi:sugar porter (SP) family MFS transporter